MPIIRVSRFLPILAVTAATLATIAPAALADGWPVNTATSTAVGHFAPRAAKVSGLTCTRPSNVVATCSMRATVGSEVYKVAVHVDMPLDGASSGRVTSATLVQAAPPSDPSPAGSGVTTTTAPPESELPVALEALTTAWLSMLAWLD